MGNLFSKKSKKKDQSRIKKDDMAIAELKITRDKLKSYSKKLETNISALKKSISECIKSKKKDQALLLLRKQKFLEKNLNSTRGELLNIEALIVNVENAQVQQQVFQALKQGNDILNKINKDLTLDDVEKLMAETDEAIEYQREIGLALSGQGVEENQDLLEELEKLEENEYENLPSVPDRPVVQEVAHKKQKKVVIENS